MLARKNKYDKIRVQNSLIGPSLRYKDMQANAIRIDDFLFILEKRHESQHKNSDVSAELVASAVSLAETFDDWRKVFFSTFHLKAYAGVCVDALVKKDGGSQEQQRQAGGNRLQLLPTRGHQLN